VKVVVTRIGQDGTVWRRMINTAERPDGDRWETHVTNALAAEPPPYRPVTGSPVCHVRVDDHVVLVAEQDLDGPLRDLATAVLAVGDAYSPRARRTAAPEKYGCGTAPRPDRQWKL
jgi:hypothetical protein